MSPLASESVLLFHIEKYISEVDYLYVMAITFLRFFVFETIFIRIDNRNERIINPY